jgi:hypothetical protein
MTLRALVFRFAVSAALLASAAVGAGWKWEERLLP